MLLSNKALLPCCGSCIPEHPNLLPAYLRAGGARIGDYVQEAEARRAKAQTCRLIDGGDGADHADGGYGAEGFVYQAYGTLPRFGDDYDDRSARGSSATSPPASASARMTSPITSNTSRFVPHYFENKETQ